MRYKDGNVWRGIDGEICGGCKPPKRPNPNDKTMRKIMTERAIRTHPAMPAVPWMVNEAYRDLLKLMAKLERQFAAIFVEADKKAEKMFGAIEDKDERKEAVEAFVAKFKRIKRNRYLKKAQSIQMKIDNVLSYQKAMEAVAK